MLLRFIYCAVLLATAVILISCNASDNAVNTNLQKPAPGPQTTYADGARRITTGELEALLKNGQGFVVDVRDQASYDMGHIPGSRLIPVRDITNHVSELPRDKTIVTYCS